jgi:hypothetical protein
MFIVVALGTVGTTATAFAVTEDEEEEEETQESIETADEIVHGAFGLGSEGDVKFHQGLCAAGISTEALEENVEGGCAGLPPIIEENED